MRGHYVLSSFVFARADTSDWYEGSPRSAKCSIMRSLCPLQTQALPTSMGIPHVGLIAMVFFGLFITINRRS